MREPARCSLRVRILNILPAGAEAAGPVTGCAVRVRRAMVPGSDGPSRSHVGLFNRKSSSPRLQPNEPEP